MKDCIICGTKFVPATEKSSCCSDACKKIYSRKKADAARESERIKKYHSPDSDPNEYIECLLCGYRASEITKHIINHHDMTTDDYKKQTGGYTKCKRVRDGMSGENNPGYQHGGKLSPFSKNFVGYDSMTDDEKSTAIHETASDARKTAIANNNSSVHIEYYTSRGMSLEDAKKALSDRQSTFSLEKCIDEYGEVEGRARWQARQDLWQHNLNDKSPEELADMHAQRVSNRNYSKFGTDSDYGGTFYIVKLSDDRIKFGVTSKPTVKERFSPHTLKNTETVLEKWFDSISHASKLEDHVKKKYWGNVVKGDYGKEVGWTEIIHGVPVEQILEDVDNFTP